MIIQSIDDILNFSETNVREHCGIVVAHDPHDVYHMMKAINHRGREAAGIAAIGKDRIDVMKWVGTVSAFDEKAISNIFEETKAHTYIGHVRYATRGRKDKLLLDAHPHTIGGTMIDHGNHVIIRDCEAAIVHNGQIDEKYITDIDKSKLRTDCDTEALLHWYIENGERQILKKIPGSYTIAIASKNRKDVIVLTDSLGIKPGSLGKKHGKFIANSETVAFTKTEGEWVKDLQPGTIYYLEPEGGYREENIMNPTKYAHCMFCWNYISNQESIVRSVPVISYRNRLGTRLTQEFHPEDIDIVSFVPRCPEPAAIGYAQEFARINKKRYGDIYKEIFYKRNSTRSFIGSTAEERAESITNNLYVSPNMMHELHGKTVCLIDDSIVRGNNSKVAIDRIKDCGVKKVYFLSYTPPVGIIGEDGIPRGCSLGVDMPPNDSFIIRKTVEINGVKTQVNRSVDEVGELLGAQVYYLSMEGMLQTFESFGMPRDKLCTYCIGGSDPREKFGK